jgi:Zn-dependent M16 (insulinase) family peptidase
VEGNHSIKNYELVSTRFLPDFQAELYEYRHIRTGARICWLNNHDENKTFAICFKTIPSDDTGVFHILEHSVLNGSDRYPVKEPFVELLKSSMNTFLNAITFDDKTIYPISSRNEKDFMNLMSVYLDAVFCPAVRHNPNIFYQEGWHYEIHKADEQPVYKGVVLNEMKGAFANVDETVLNAMNRLLFPDSCYQYVSGGDPACITDLSYEDFVAAHKKFYQPGNARIWLDGDLNVEKVLTYIDENYLAKGTKMDQDFEIPMQQAAEGRTITVPFEISAEEDDKNRSIISFGRIMSRFDDARRNIALSALSEVLTGNNDAPLKKPLLEKGLCEDVSFDLYDGIQQPYCLLTVRNTQPEKLDEIKAVIKDVIASLRKKGIDKSELTAALNQMEFHYREKQEPSGVMNAEDAMESWLYGGDPALYLNVGSLYQQLREEADSGYFEKLLDEFFADDGRLQTVIAVADRNAGKARVEAEQKKLSDAKQSWPDVNAMVKATKSLEAWQAAPDSTENLNTLPKLTLDDVEKVPRKDEYEETEYNDVPVLVYPKEPSGIVYLNLYFNIAGLRREMLPEAGFLTSLLGELPTAHHTVAQLQKLVHTWIGSLTFTPVSYAPDCDPAATLPMIAVRCSVLSANKEKALDLIKEILTETQFDPKLILPLLRQSVQDFEQTLTSSGHAFAAGRINARLSADGVFSEYTAGFTSGRWLESLEADYADKIDEVIQDLKLFRDNLFLTSRLTISVTEDGGIDWLHALIDGLPKGDAHRAKVHYPLLAKQNEGIVIPGDVSYAARGVLLPAYDAHIHVMTHLLTYDWLWNEVRVKGGAYGTGISGNSLGGVTAYSYRDPDPANALHAFANIGTYLHEKAEENMDITSYVIGAIAAVSPLLSPRSRIIVSDARWFGRISYETRCENRRKMLHSTIQKLDVLGTKLSDAMKEGPVCIIGPAAKLAQMKDEHLTILPPRPKHNDTK